jgi:hypothetical protein
MDQQHLSAPACAQVSPARRLVAAGIIRRLAGRTLTVRATAAGVTGSITKASAARAARVAELHRLCDQDYADAKARRQAQHHRDDAHLIAYASEAVTAR